MPISQSQQSKHCQSATARIGTLATLPVFFDLKGKPVLLIGGTEAATWKAELLAATGAKVEVHALEFCDEMQSLAARNDLTGSVTLVCQPWSLKIFGGKSLVVGDAETEGEAKAIYCAARAAGVPVNIIDNPTYCTFKFGTIVNRSPVVIGISTDGAAPVLGQAIRTRIETLLPQALAQWASYAKEIRETVLQRLNAGPKRRSFWAQFAHLSFGPFVPQDAWRVAGIADQRSNAGSVVVLKVPAIDPGLLTLNDVRMLQNADAIYFNSSVRNQMLDHARREAMRIAMDSMLLEDSDVKCAIKAITQKISQGSKVILVHTNTGEPPDWVEKIVWGLQAQSTASNKQHVENLAYSNASILVPSATKTHMCEA